MIGLGEGGVADPPLITRIPFVMFAFAGLAEIRRVTCCGRKHAAGH